MKRVFLYVRVSTEEQVIHGLSIEAQTAALKSWAAENGHKVIGVYTDAGISGRKPASKRPELQRLLSDVQAGKGDLIIFTKLDRWFRNIAEYYKVQEVLEKCHVDWRTIHEDYDTSTSSGRLKVNIMLSVAQDEADRTSERIKAIFETKRNKLEPLTGQMPYGYLLVDKKIIKDPKTEEAVNLIFKTFLLSGSIALVRQKLEADCGIQMDYQQVNRILKNTAYYGRYFSVDGMTPPYITKAEFERIEASRRRIVRKTAHNRLYIFSGLIVCGECGQRMGGRVNTNQESFFYNCTKHYQAGYLCDNNRNLGERKIEQFLFDTILSKMEQLKIDCQKLHEAQKNRNYKREIAALRAKLEKLKTLYLNDLITLEEYKADHESYKQQIAALEEESAVKEYRSLEVAEKLLQDGWIDVYRDMNREQKQGFWRILIKEIRIFKNNRIEYDLNH